MITPTCNKCIYLSNQTPLYRRFPKIPILHRNMVCCNEDNLFTDHILGDTYMPFCEEINRHGECRVYYPEGLNRPTIDFDTENNIAVITGTNPFIVTDNGMDITDNLDICDIYNTESKLYELNLPLEHTAIIKAACILDGVLSKVAELKCEIADIPSIDFNNKTNTVTINSYNTVYYSFDGTDITSETIEEADSVFEYSEPFILEANKTIKAKSLAREILSEQITKECVTIEPPIISFNDETNIVSISADDSILYSVDGSDIYDDADEYVEPFEITRNTTVKAACIVDGELSEQTTILCKVPSIPTISFDSNTKTVSISGENTILYTTDGSDVRKKDVEYTKPFKITTTTTVKAKTVVNNKLSDQSELTCTV